MGRVEKRDVDIGRSEGTSTTICYDLLIGGVRAWMKDKKARTNFLEA